MDKISTILRIIIEKFIGGITFLVLYIPIIVGILAPMLFVIAWNLYISWYIIGPNLTDWTWYYYLIPPNLVNLFIGVEIVIFCVGLGLFLIGLITMIQKKVGNVKLIESGIYRYIRHPQNIGIIIMAFPFTLYVPGFEDLGIRMGEIASWLIFAFLISLYSYYDEWRLLKHYNNLFIEYYKRTGFFIPKFIKRRRKHLTLENLRLKIFVAIIVFILILVSFYTFVMLSTSNLMMYK
ncbi:MAG: methyltransferase family protein [Candidatus Odinarchaeota archaeon]